VSTLEYGKFEHCIVFVCGHAALDDHEWRAYLDFISKNLTPDGPNRSFVIAPGSALTSTQRRELASTIQPFSKTLKSAVVTESAVVRGIITALEWFHRDVFRIFSPSEQDRACDFLDLRAPQARRVKELAVELQHKLTSGKTSAA
jgi:hypothetical protein